MKIRLIALLLLLASLPLPGLARADDQAYREALDLARKGRALHRSDDLDSMRSARDLYLGALKKSPDFCRTTPQLCANLGHAYFVLGEPEAAIEQYHRALKFFPDYGAPYFGLGQVYENLNLPGFALDSYLKAYFLDRNDLESRAKAAQIFYRLCEKPERIGNTAEDVGGKGLDQRSLEDKLLVEKAFSEWNRRLFFCDRKRTKVEFVMRDITFEPAKAVLEKSAYRQIDLVGRILAERSDLRVIIEGHTDSIPFANKKVEVNPGVFCRDNLCLSKARAQAVKNALLERFGLPAERIRVEAHGDSRPLDPGNTPRAQAKNRRVTLVLDQQ
ncbi:MAG: OmpA family protein [Pseudomonadota bacterium]